MRTYDAEDANAPTLIFGHGAGAGHDHPWIVRVATGMAGRGIRVVTFDFPYKAEKRKLPDKGPVLEEAFQKVWDEVFKADRVDGRVPRAYLAGGKSMGARISSQAAARHLFSPAPAGLVFFGYPLHPPGKPRQRRDAHLPTVGAPMLFLHGEKDPFGTPDEMRSLVKDQLGGAPGATLEVIAGGDHSLAAPKGKDPQKLSVDRAMDLAASWIMRTIEAIATPRR